MNHQLAEFKHECGTISVFDRGILVSSEKGELFLGEDFVANFDLFCSFLDLYEEGIVTRFGGFVSGDEGQPPTEELYVHWLHDDRFTISDGRDEGAVIPVNLSFLNVLAEAAGFLLVDGALKDGGDWQRWCIHGEFPWSELSFAINEKGFEIYAPDGDHIYVFATSRKDRRLWIRALALGKNLLGLDLLPDSWQIIRAPSGTRKAMRLEPDEGRLLLSLDDPELPNVNVSIYLDGVTAFGIELLLDAVWPSGDDEAVQDVLLLTWDDDDDEGEEGAS